MHANLALIPATGAHRQPAERLAQRVLLYADELYRVPPVYRQVRAKQGIGHLSHGGRDFILRAGESVRFAGAKDVALISPLHSESLVLELFE
jgi:hypothetical protein